MRRIALVNQKGGVGKTTTAANLGAALAYAGRRVLLVDLDPQGNLSTHLSVEVPPGHPSTYSVLCEGMPLSAAMVPTAIANLSIVGTNIDLSGAEMELAAAIGRESILNDAVDDYIKSASDEDRFDYLIFDCPPSLGLLSVNGLVASREVFIALQTEFFALQGMSKLVEIVQLLKRRLNPELEISGIIPCLYDSRLRLAREVLAEIRRYFPGPVFRRSIRANVKLAEAPSYGQSIFEYAPSSPGASDYAELAQEVIAQEAPGSVPERAPAPVQKAAVPAQFQNDPAPRADASPDESDDSGDSGSSDQSVTPEVQELVDETPEHATNPTPEDTTNSAKLEAPVSDPVSDPMIDQNVEVQPVEAPEIEPDESDNATPSQELNEFAAQLASDTPSTAPKANTDALESELAALTRRPAIEERTPQNTPAAPDRPTPQAPESSSASHNTTSKSSTTADEFEGDVLRPVRHSQPSTILRADDLPPLPEDAFRIGER